MASLSGEEEVELLAKHSKELLDHFDTVQIFATRLSPKQDGTINCTNGAGNWFARYGQVKEWVVKQDAISAKQGVDSMDD